jgi:hypothetical protein
MSLSDRRRADAPAATLADAAYRAPDRAGIAWALIDATLPAGQVRAHAHGALWRLLSPTGS